MFNIDSDKCTGCGVCVDACPQHAISVRNNLAVINQGLCGQCGICAQICPTGAIYEVAPVPTAIGGREPLTFPIPWGMPQGVIGLAFRLLPGYRGNQLRFGDRKGRWRSGRRWH